jgi:hypothetical protein
MLLCVFEEKLKLLPKNKNTLFSLAQSKHLTFQRRKEGKNRQKGSRNICSCQRRSHRLAQSNKCSCAPLPHASLPAMPEMNNADGAQVNLSSSARAPATVVDEAAVSAQATVSELPPEFFDSSAPPVLGAARTEHTVVPGIYFTPATSGSTAVSGEGGLGGAARDPGAPPRYTDIALLGRDDLVYQERELSKRIAKLIESNTEILSFDPEGEDADLVQAREENDKVITREEQRLEMMRLRLEYLDPCDHTN